MANEVAVLFGPHGKACRDCGEIKPLSEFSPQGKGLLGVRSYCKPCGSERGMRWRDANLDRATNAHLQRKYGITLDEYNALLADQEGVCAICGESPSIANFKFSKRPGRRPPRPRLVVDHDHATGQVRGLLCSLCNTGIGNLREDPGRIRAALRYLEGEQ